MNEKTSFVPLSGESNNSQILHYTDIPETETQLNNSNESDLGKERPTPKELFELLEIYISDDHHKSNIHKEEPT